jgi:type VII secretion-associated protein (TIGR03931 family)
VTEVIVEAGPALVRGPGVVDTDLAAAAIEYIDDHLALVGDQPIPVGELWHEVLLSAAGSSAETLVLVCPTWWAAPRVERVCEVARSIAANVIALQRRSVLGAGRTVVEIAPEIVVVWREADTVVIHRRGGPNAVAEVVAKEVGPAVVVDAPAGVHGAAQLATALADHLRAKRVAVSVVDADSVRDATAELRAGERRESDAEGARPTNRPGRRGVGALTGAALSVAILCAALAAGPDVPPAEEVAMTLLVEGRVGVEIPASWTVQRITSGPGSARVQVISPTDPHTAVHITQSPIPPRQTRAMVAETLRKALDQQPADVFVDFNPADRKADKPVVSYREFRPGHHIAWAVLSDDTVRIGIGCQSAPDRYQQVRYACDEAIRSAHAVF